MGLKFVQSADHVQELLKAAPAPAGLQFRERTLTAASEAVAACRCLRSSELACAALLMTPLAVTAAYVSEYGVMQQDPDISTAQAASRMRQQINALSALFIRCQQRLLAGSPSLL